MVTVVSIVGNNSKQGVFYFDPENHFDFAEDFDNPNRRFIPNTRFAGLVEDSGSPGSPFNTLSFGKTSGSFCC